MKTLSPIVLFAVLLFAFASISAQQEPPPPAPDYNPKGWNEYSFPDDNIRFRFPVKPKREESTVGNDKRPSISYRRQSFMLFEVSVISLPADRDPKVDDKTALNGGVQGMLNQLKDREPKVLTQEDITVDSYPAKFIKAETNNGLVLRVKFFIVKDKLYIAQAIVKKGDRHGFNWENDFEIPAMAFLDSFHVIAAQQIKPSPTQAPERLVLLGASDAATPVETIKNSAESVANGIFTSKGGKFSIAIQALPTRTTDNATEKAKAKNIDVGKQFIWIFERTLYTLYYNPPVDNDGKPSTHVYADMQIGTRKGILNGGATLISEKPFTHGKYKGTEFRYSISNGVRYINRVFLVGDMGYQVVGGYADAKDETAVLAVLDSFTPLKK